MQRVQADPRDPFSDSTRSPRSSVRRYRNCHGPSSKDVRRAAFGWLDGCPEGIPASPHSPICGAAKNATLESPPDSSVGVLDKRRTLKPLNQCGLNLATSQESTVKNWFDPVQGVFCLNGDAVSMCHGLGADQDGNPVRIWRAFSSRLRSFSEFFVFKTSSREPPGPCR